MKNRMSGQFFRSYIIIFVMSIMATFLVIQLMSFADSIIAKTLVKNYYTAASIMCDDYAEIDSAIIAEHNGGVQVVSKNLEVVFSDGLNVLGEGRLSRSAFTDFLIDSKSVGIPYGIDIQYNDRAEFWLIVTFPTSVRIDFAIAYNKAILSKDVQSVIGLIVALVLFYVIMLTFGAMIYSKFTAIRVTNPLQKLVEGTKGLRYGDYSTRVHLNLKNEFAELQETFNAMASQIEYEISRRQKSEENLRKLIRDISHDLKNPLTAVSGYSERCLTILTPSGDELTNYLRIIYHNSIRASKLLTSLFELSQMESSEFNLVLCRQDICEYIREFMSNYVSVLDGEGFSYRFDVPEREIFAMIDREQMNRVFTNLLDNTLKYNPAGTEVSVRILREDAHAVIIFADNGIGIPAAMAKDIFLPFVRGDIFRDAQTGGTGLGLSIVFMIVQKHGGRIELETDSGAGCVFKIRLPVI